MAVIAIDFDHTLIDTPTKAVLPGAREAVNILREHGHKVIIHSCNDSGWIARWLNDNDIRYDHIWCEKGKPLADLYVDDKGFHLTEWENDLDAILGRVQGLDNRKW